MNERLPFSTSTTLSRELTHILRHDNITPQIVERLQDETSLYFFFDPDTFGGVIAHPPGKGPERPVFRPTTKKDWQPQIQAIGRIGMQALYWEKLYEGLCAKSLSLRRLRSMVVLPLYLNENGESEIDVGAKTEPVQFVATSVGDTALRLKRYIKTINYGGDADFYGLWINSIFPMEVAAHNGIKVAVDISALGLDEKTVRATWDGWQSLLAKHSEIYDEIVKEVINSNSLPDSVKAILGNYTERFRSDFDLVNPFLNTKNYDAETMDDVFKTLDASFRKLYSNNRIDALVNAARKHKENLRMMYETAKAYRSDIYHY